MNKRHVTGQTSPEAVGGERGARVGVVGVDRLVVVTPDAFRLEI